ncbi:MAG: response regulator, partial [Sphingomonas sp.]
GTVADFGHHTIQAEDGAAALALLEQGVPDLMFVDFAMPGMNGAALARAARERFPGLPIVFVTGFAESDQLEGALADVPVLRKPFGVGALAAVLRTVLPEETRNRS